MLTWETLKVASIFLSTPSARRATRPAGPRTGQHGHFYPRPPRGGRHRPESFSFALFIFLSTPSARRATPTRPRRPRTGTFLSTPSARRATGTADVIAEMIQFLSTPSARRATKFTAISSAKHPNFYPRPPRGGRPGKCLICALFTEISIHALREEGDAGRFKSDVV